MYLFKLFLLCFSCYMCLAEENVLELRDHDFESGIAEYEIALVMFYAPWCGHCKKLKPEYDKAAENLIKNDPPIALIKVECIEAGKGTCNKHSVSSYPTLKVFRNGSFSHEYKGPREARNIVKHMKSQVGLGSIELSSVEELEQFLGSENDCSVVGFFKKETDLKTAFFKLADKLRGQVRFAHSTCTALLKKQGINDGIILYRPRHLHNKFENGSVAYSGAAVTKDINNFIKKNYHGLVGHRNFDNQKDFRNPLVVAYYGVDYVKNPKITNYWRNRILKVAKQYKDSINFAVSAKNDFEFELNEYGIDYVKDDKPIILARGTKNEKFIMKDPFSVESLEQFVQDLLAGKLETYLKTEPIPENNDGPVKVAVAKNFNEIVVNSGKDTLIEFYAPWCGHCKKLAPVYDDLGQKLKNEDVDIVKMDATANDVPPTFDVSGFPTLYWIPKNSKDSPVPYDGGRGLNDFIKYISEHATSELRGYDRKGNPKLDKTEL